MLNKVSDERNKGQKNEKIKGYISEIQKLYSDSETDEGNKSEDKTESQKDKLKKKVQTVRLMKEIVRRKNKGKRISE